MIVRLTAGKSRIPTLIEMPPRVCIESFSFDESTHCGRKLKAESKESDKGDQNND